MVYISDEKHGILEEIKDKVEEMFSESVTEHEAINKGFLNLKWKFKIDNKLFFIKQYNMERYPASKEHRLNTALSFHMKLNGKGIRCPHIITFNGDAIIKTRKDTRFIIMEYCDGNVVNAGKINSKQSYDLGFELAKIHSIINDQTCTDASPSWVVPSREQLLAQCNENLLSSKYANTENINNYHKLRKEIFESIDTDIFKKCKHGWAHSDLWCDNVLFHADSLSVILDFDRMQYIYPELDISRAVLSFALDGNYLKIDTIRSFMDGYNMVGNISIDDIICSLKLLYCLESFWWLNDDSLNSEGPPKRFGEEIIWMSNNWFNLENILNTTVNTTK